MLNKFRVTASTASYRMIHKLIHHLSAKYPPKYSFVLAFMTSS